MNLKGIIGVRIGHSQIREDNRTFFFNGRWHKTPDTTLFQINKGEALFKIQGRRVIAKKGDIVYYDRGAFQDYRSLGGKAISYSVITLSLACSDKKERRLGDLGFPHHIKPRNPAAIRTLLGRINKTLHSRSDKAAMECSFLGLELLENLALGYKGRIAETKSLQEMDARIEGVLGYLDANYKKRLDIKTLAARACLHPVHFARLFKKATGLTPSRFIMEYKIRRAKDFLLAYDEPLLNAGEELGFHDYSHFYRSFKQVTGLTPAQFILKHKGRCGRQWRLRE